MADYILYYWPVPFRGHFIRAILAYAEKTWDEPLDVQAVMKLPPCEQPFPFMAPPLLVNCKTGFALAQMPAIAFYLATSFNLLPHSVEGQAKAMKVINDANDVIDEITCQGGQTLWTAESWKRFMPRLRRWMDIFETTGQLHGLKKETGFLLGGGGYSVADIVTATLWGTLCERFPKLGVLLKKQAPLIHGLTERLKATGSFIRLSAYSREHFHDSYCGGEIEGSLREVNRR